MYFLTEGVILGDNIEEFGNEIVHACFTKWLMTDT